MKSVLKSYVDSFALGRGERHRNMTVFPILSPLNGAPDYLTLKEALEKGLFIVAEVSEGGTVPNLKVSNKADLPALLLDGEGIVGSALLVDEKLIHMAVFAATDTEKAGNMAGMSRRRSFRT